MLRSGITTGTCAAAAASAAARVLAGEPAPLSVEVDMPEGGVVRVPVCSCYGGDGFAVAAVVKDAGDDPDVTNGAAIEVKVCLAESGDIVFRAGPGVGVVTMPGLAVKPGEPAINPVPRRMIAGAVRQYLTVPVEITVSIPGGAEIAQRTFNERLGIEGGLSILGTTGIVRPFSNKAVRETVRCAINVAYESGVRHAVIVPGNIGRRAALKMFELEKYQVVEAGNEWGFALDTAAAMEFEALLVVGHPGKLAKLAAGEWDTHSARSGSAIDALQTLLPPLYSDVIRRVKTVEAFFKELDFEKAKEAGDLTAEAVRAAVSGKLPGTMAAGVFLIDLKGDRLGSAGNLKMWKERG